VDWLFSHSEELETLLAQERQQSQQKQAPQTKEQSNPLQADDLSDGTGSTPFFTCFISSIRFDFLFFLSFVYAMK
jgi:hypothetical protein